MTDTWLVWGLCGDLGVESLMHDGRSKQIIMMFSHRTYQTIYLDPARSELTIGPPLCMCDFGLNLLLDASTRMESIDYAIGHLC
jgi:hypothetical protein